MKKEIVKQVRNPKFFLKRLIDTLSPYNKLFVTNMMVDTWQKSGTPLSDTGKWKARIQIDKFTGEFIEGMKPVETLVFEGNALANNGINEMLDLLIGTGGALPFASTAARIGVGSNTVTATNYATSTNLWSTGVVFCTMDATYPSVTNQTVTFRSTFGTTWANFAWWEWGIDNSQNKLLNQKVETLGTKTVAQSWQITASITIS